jgi:immune inhibitor A
VTPRSLALVVVVSTLTVPAVTSAQQASPPRVRREIPGFDFRKDGVWRRQARAVRALRARLWSRGNFGALNAPMAAAAAAPLGSAPAVSGVLRVPAILFKFKNTPASELRTTTQYNQVLFGAAPMGAAAGRPYTYRTFYEQMSNGLLSVQGQAYGYAALDSNEVTYTGVAGTCTGNPYGNTNCNGLFSQDAQTRMQAGLREALRKLDSQVDWTQYDSDGDGYVDLVAFIHPPVDGACGGPTNNHLWSHRYYLANAFGNVVPYTTHSVNSQGVSIKVADYILESGVGGLDGCDTTQIMPVGTVAHETGHGFSLPDLYDTDNMSEGVGEWSLMGSGNYTSPFSPSRMDAWSLSQLGWVTVVPLPTNGTFSFGAAPTSDTAFFLPVGGANPRGEYFLLENRQAVQSDSAMVHYHCRVWGSPTPPCGGGLLIYHVDSAQIAQHGFDQDNRVNTAPIHGLELVQADGLGNLDANPNTACSGAGPTCSDRGDAGDPYPGTTGNVAFTSTSSPAAVRNADGLPAGLVLDQITQLAPDGAMRFRLTYPVWVVRATDSAAVIQFDAVTYHEFRDILTPGTMHNVGVADTQFTAGGRTRQVFVSWSGGQARTFSYTVSASPETLTVTLARSHQIHYSATSGGTISGSVANDTFVTEGTGVTLTATDTSTVRSFQGWAGDTVTKNLSVTLPMSRPYSVRAVFLETFSTAQLVAQLLNGSSTLTAAQLGDLDQLGNNNGGFDLGDFLAWVEATGAPLTAEQRALVGAARRKGATR